MEQGCREMRIGRAAALVAGAVAAALTLGSAHAASVVPTPAVLAAAPSVVVAAGDIACSPHNRSFHRGRGNATDCHMAATARVAARAAPDAVLALGDTQYGDGSVRGYRRSWRLSWARFDPIIRPALGDEEYEARGARGYFRYFGRRAGPRRSGFYSFDVGTWHLIALNSECRRVACRAGAAQEAFLRADLAAHPAACTLAYWHRPRFTSGRGAQATDTDSFWRTLHAAGADVVLGGHSHDYERFALQTPDGVPDPATGIREFVAGTGGKSLAPFDPLPRPNSEVRLSAYGVLVLTLHPGAYDWRFVSESGAVLDAGSGACH
jgi:opacity protein-like surface antigen